MEYDKRRKNDNPTLQNVKPTLHSFQGAIGATSFSFRWELGIPFTRPHGDGGGQVLRAAIIGPSEASGER